MCVDVGALKEGTRPTAMHRFTNNVSLNDNTNVRNCLNENIYTPGVFDLELQGGYSCGYVLGEWIRAYSAGGVSSHTSGGRARVGHAQPRITHRPRQPPRLHALCLNAST
jgi:hypothetical protein